MAHYLSLGPEQMAQITDNLAILDRDPDTADEDTNLAEADNDCDDLDGDSVSEGDSFRQARPPNRGITTPQPRPWRGTGFARCSIATNLVPPGTMPESPQSPLEEVTT